MPNVRPLLFTLLPLFAGCQLFRVYVPPTPATPAVRLQGELTTEQDRLLLRPCGEQRRLGLVSEKTGELRRDVDNLRADGQSSLFVDLRGWPQGSQQADLDGEVRLDGSIAYRAKARAATSPASIVCCCAPAATSRTGPWGSAKRAWCCCAPVKNPWPCLIWRSRCPMAASA